jgi:hypothetical protein
VSDAGRLTKLTLRSLLKLMWSRGGGSDAFPRVWGRDLEALLAKLQPGDVVVMGNGGELSHVGLHVGQGTLVHSMATEHTMRGLLGSLWDALRRPLWALLGKKEKTGVIEEEMADFFDRYERDTWVVVRREGLSSEQQQAGVAHVRTLVGKAYDYDFSPGDDEYYCSELILEFFEAAGGVPAFTTRSVHLPMLLRQDVFDPVAFVTSGELRLVEANGAAWQKHEAALSTLEQAAGRPTPEKELPNKM